MIARAGLTLLLLPLLLPAASPAALAQAVPEAQLKAIYARSPEEMAAAGAWTRSAYDRLPQPFLASPATGDSAPYEVSKR